MSFPRYPEYKDSGVEWLGEVPEHWEINQLKHAYSVIGGATPSSGVPEFWDGDIAWVTPADLSRLKSFEIVSSLRTITAAGMASCGTNLLPVGSIVLSTRAPIGSLGIAGVELCTNQGCKGLVPKSEQCSLFGAYLLAVMGGELNIQGRGTTFLELSGEALGAVKIPLPPESEQACIAAFSDRETAKIDALVAEQQNLIALLKEKRQALISHAVTKGLDPDVPMKDSGVAWLGEVPAHWEIWKIAHAFGCIGSGTTPPSNEPKWYYEGEIPWVTTGELRENLVTSTAKCVTHEAVETFSSLRVHPTGSLVIAMYGATIGRLGLLGVDATTNQACCVLSSPKNLHVPFVFHWLSAFKDHLINLYASGGGQPNINQEIVASLRIPAPPPEEQIRIVAALDEEVAQLQSLIDEAECTIALLQERRTALISAAVTGKIDVRHLAAASAIPTPEPV